MLDPLGFKHPNNIKRIGGVCLAKPRKYLRYPDFYDKEENGIVIDAKYKRKIDVGNDVNQIITYMYRLKGKLGLFILPEGKNADPQVNLLNGYGEVDGAGVMSYSMDIPRDCRDYEDFKAKMKTAEANLVQEIQKRQKQISLPNS